MNGYEVERILSRVVIFERRVLSRMTQLDDAVQDLVTAVGNLNAEFKQDIADAVAAANAGDAAALSAALQNASDNSAKIEQAVADINSAATSNDTAPTTPVVTDPPVDSSTPIADSVPPVSS